jgi:hypothetical protein
MAYQFRGTSFLRVRQFSGARAAMSGFVFSWGRGYA